MRATELVRTQSNLLAQAQHTLRLSQAELGKRLGASARTGHRWAVGRAHPSATQLARLAELVHDANPDLAEVIADAAGTTLEKLGLVKPSEGATPALTPDRVVDCVVCAAAEAMDVPPKAIRAALLAAFARARELGITVEVMEASLRAAGEATKGGPGGKRPTKAAPTG